MSPLRHTSPTARENLCGHLSRSDYDVPVSGRDLVTLCVLSSLAGAVAAIWTIFALIGGGR